MSSYADSLPVRVVNDSIPVTIADPISVTGPVSISATDLDIRNLSHTTDSIKIGDGTNFLSINSDGSINLTTLNTNRLFWDTDTDWNKGTLGADVEVSGAGAAAVIRPNTVHVVDPDVYAVWHLNETTGTAIADSSGNARDAVFTAGSGGFVAGKLNNAITFSGDGIVDGGDIAGFEYTQPFSLECWMQYTNDGNPRTLMGRIDRTVPASPGYMFVTDNGFPGIYIINDISGGVYISVFGDTPLSNATWHHLVCTYDGSGLAAGVAIYVDGVAQTLTIGADNLLAGSILNTKNFIVGSADTVEFYYFGEIDEVVIYTRAISQADVDFRYNTGTGTETILGIDEFKTAAHYETNIADSKIAGQLWGEFNFSRTVPSGTTVVVKCRVSNDQNSMGSYGSSLTPGTAIGLTGQFIQFSVDFTGTDTVRSTVEYISSLYVAPSVIDVEP